MSNLDKKIEQAKRLLRLAEDEAASHGQPVEISYSGGKDSDIILHLAREAGINHRAIYKMTTIDPAGTIQHCREAGAEILKPKRSFFELIQTSGFPTRWARFCCDRLKEYKVLEVAVQGIRRSESHDRERRYSEPTICRIYGSKKNHVSVYLPILEWTEDDVKQYIEANTIRCHSLYYRGGQFDPTQRLGCLCCPLLSQKRLRNEFKQYPGMVAAYIRNGLIWWEQTKGTSRAKFGTIYDLFYHNLFCSSYADYQLKTSGFFGKADCKQLLENYFNIQLR